LRERVNDDAASVVRAMFAMVEDDMVRRCHLKSGTHVSRMLMVRMRLGGRLVSC